MISSIEMWTPLKLRLFVPVLLLTSPSTRSAETRFGLLLSPVAYDLLAEVEREYGKRILEQNLITSDVTRFAESDIADDGSPIIRINREVNLREDVIVHELMHLRLQASGLVHTIRWEGSPEVNKPQNKLYWSRLYDALFVELIHSAFYPSMRTLGYEPDRMVKVQVRELLTGNWRPGTNPDTLAMFAFMVGLNVKDRLLVRKVRRWYAVHGADAGQLLADRMLRVARRSRPNTSENLMAVFVECANIVVEDRVRFTFEQFEDRRLGTFNQKLAVIRIEGL